MHALLRPSAVMLCLAGILLSSPAWSFGSFKANREVWDEQYRQCHGSDCDGNHEQWLLPVLDTSEGIYCYYEGDPSIWPPGRCMACGQTLNAWLLNLYWDHTTPTGSWYHFFYWGDMAKVRTPVHEARQYWMQEYRPEACPGMHGAYVVGVDHRWKDYTPSIDFNLPRMSLDPVLPGVVERIRGDLGRDWDELGRWARRIIVFGEVYDTYAGVPPAAVPVIDADLLPGNTVLEYWDRAYSLAWQWWIYESGASGENTLERDRPGMASQAPLETGIPERSAADAADMQDIIDETYSLFGEILTPIEPATWGGIKALYRDETERPGDDGAGGSGP